MIKYKLICKDCNITFDSWFSNSKEFEKLKKRKLLNCHNCDSVKVEKSLMAPKLMGKSTMVKLDQDKMQYKKIKDTLKNYQNFIKKNFRYVGKNFAYEARSIHYDNKKNKKGIYGTASKKDLKELKEEGIDTQIIPWLNDRNN